MHFNNLLFVTDKYVNIDDDISILSIKLLSL